MNIADLIHSGITGQWRIDRARTREFMEREKMNSGKRMQLYAGAEPGNKRPTPNILSTPEDYKQAYQRIVLIRAARQMEEDFPFFDGILRDFETYVVGELRYMPATGNPDADRDIADFLNWQFDQCDNSQRLDLCKLARLSIRSYKRDGECGFMLVTTGDGLKLVSISGDRIGNPLIGANIGPNNYNGIITDPTTGAPVVYDIYRRLPKLNSYVFERQVPANSFIHLYDPFRYEQYHGVTIFKNNVEHAFDIQQILEFTKLNIKWRSAQLPYVQNEQGRPRGSGYEPQAATFNGTPRPESVLVDGVSQNFLKLDEGVMEYPNDFPNQQFRGIIEELKRECSIGCGLPLEFCYQSQTGGVVQRFYANKAERTFDEDKRWLKRTLLNPYKNRSIQWGIDTGFLDLSKYGTLVKNRARFSGTWQMGRAVSVDYGKEVTADIAQIEAGLMSQDSYINEMGGDPAIVRQQIKAHARALFEDAVEISEQSKQPIETVLYYLNKRSPNQATRLTEKIVPNEPDGVKAPAANPSPVDSEP